MSIVRPLALALTLAAAPTGFSQSLAYQLDGADDSETFAKTVIPMGDQNGDGSEDYGVLVPYREIVQGPNQGKFGVIEIRSGRNGQLIQTLENPLTQTVSRFWDVVRIHDSDNDGRDDLLVTWFTGFLSNVGVIFVSSGTGAILSEPQAPPGRVLSPYAIQPIRDMDGDGLGDFAWALGAPLSGSAVGNGVVLYSGSDLAPLLLLEPANRHASYGWGVESVGDLDGDGVLDLAVSASGDDTYGNRAGAVYLHSGTTGAVIDVLYGSVPEERFGFAMESLPDIDADGVDDLAISSTFLLDASMTPFVTFFSGATRVPIRTIVSSQPDDSFGWDLTLVGDQDVDGALELAIGAPAYTASTAVAGRVEFRSIATGDKLAERFGDRPGQAFGKIILPLPDVRPNGFSEVLVAGDGLTSSGSEPGGLSVFEGPMGQDCTPSIPYCGQTVPNSVGALATLTQVSDADLSGGLFRLFGNSLPVGSPVLLLGSLETGFAAQPGGSAGNLCLGGSIGRFTTMIKQVGPSGRVVFRPDLSAMPTPAGPVQATPSQVWHFQAWYRDMDPSGAAGSNFTSALSVDICP